MCEQKFLCSCFKLENSWSIHHVDPYSTTASGTEHFFVNACYLHWELEKRYMYLYNVVLFLTSWWYTIDISFGYIRSLCFFYWVQLGRTQPHTPHSRHNSWHTWYFCQEGQTIVENKTANIIQETRKLNIRRKGAGPNTQGEAGHKKSTWPWNSVEGISRRKVANMC